MRTSTLSTIIKKIVDTMGPFCMVDISMQIVPLVEKGYFTGLGIPHSCLATKASPLISIKEEINVYFVGTQDSLMQ